MNEVTHFLDAIEQGDSSAAVAMRRILIDHARAKQADKRGGDWQRVPLEAVENMSLAAPDELLVLDETLTALSRHDPLGAKLVELRYFAGLSVEEPAEALGISHNTANRWWAYAKAFLYREINSTPAD